MIIMQPNHGLRTSLLVGLLFAITLGVLPAQASSNSLIPTMENYFALLKNDFKTCAASPDIKSKYGKRIKDRFLKTLKAHQPMYSVLLTNSKGQVTAEVIRGEKLSSTKKNLGKQTWFIKVRKSLKEIDAVVKETNGRYYLLWCVANVQTIKKHQKFGGVLVAKVDLWDCFQQISQTTSEPFCVRMGAMTLYAHLWENQRMFIEDTLLIPGTSKVLIRHQNSGVSALQAPQISDSGSRFTQKESAAEQEAAATVPLDTGHELASAPKVSKSNVPIVIGLIVLICIITLILIIQLVGRIKHLMILKSIDKQNHR